MEALWLEDDTVALDLDRCIGCGLCVSTCPTESLTLERKPESEQHKLPKDITETTLRLGRSLGKLGPIKLVMM